VRKFHGLMQTKLSLPPASSSEIDEKSFEKWVQELTLAITDPANKSAYLTHTKRCLYWDKQLNRIKKNLCRAKKRRDQVQTRNLKKRLKSRLRANKRRHEAKIASQVTPINAFSSTYQIAPKAKPTRKKQPESQPRTLDPARTATELCSKFAAIQSFPKHLSKHLFPEISSPTLISSRKSRPGLPQPQSKPPYSGPPLLPLQDLTSSHPASSDSPGPPPSDSR